MAAKKKQADPRQQQKDEASNMTSRVVAASLLQGMDLIASMIAPALGYELEEPEELTVDEIAQVAMAVQTALEYYMLSLAQSPLLAVVTILAYTSMNRVKVKGKIEQEQEVEPEKDPDDDDFEAGYKEALTIDIDAREVN